MSARHSVAVLIVNERGELFLQFRDARAAVEPLKWGLWGGRREAGDADAHATAVRELSEELALTASADALEPLLDIELAADWRVSVLVLMRPVTWSDILIREGAGGGFFPREDAANLDLAAYTRALFDRCGVDIDDRIAAIAPAGAAKWRRT